MTKPITAGLYQYAASDTCLFPALLRVRSFIHWLSSSQSLCLLLLERRESHCQTAKKTTDVVEFLHDVLKVKELPARFPHVVSVHNSCHGVRELGLSSPSELNTERYSKIKDLLGLVGGITVREPERVDECCGFGGMFSVEEPEVSVRMGTDKIERHMATGAEYVTGPDSSCLMHMEGIARRLGKPIKFVHVVEILSAGL